MHKLNIFLTVFSASLTNLTHKIDITATAIMFLLPSEFELSKLRKAHKMTQKQVAEATGLSVQCISDIESETGGNPTLKSIIRYLNCFGYELYFQKKTT